MSAAPKYSPSDRLESRRPLAAIASALGQLARSRVALVLILEMIWLGASGFALVQVSQALTEDPPDWMLSASQLGTVIFIYAFAFYLMDLYDLDIVAPRRALVLNLVQAIGLVCVTIGLLERCFDGLAIPLRLVLFHAGLTASFVIISRTAVDWLLRDRAPSLRLGFVGRSAAHEQLEKEKTLLAWLGFSLSLAGESLRDARRHLAEATNKFDRLVIDDACLGQQDAAGLIQAFERDGVKVEKLTSFRERAFGKLEPGPLTADELLVVNETQLPTAGRAIRRVRDVILASAVLTITTPLMLIIAIAIKCDSPGGSIFFLQDRVGKNGRRFKMIKFRSMYQGREEDRARALPQGPEWTTYRRDPRITRVGALMRGYHLDELPQLINVLKGD
ncbi:MAG: sugar transferase, partial [Deltaproteobacteria bacterium]|nr:sugar transferase [Deltaproteobacteria bacterium]